MCDFETFETVCMCERGIEGFFSQITIMVCVQKARDVVVVEIMLEFCVFFVFFIA